jgi:hypothetical protein
MKERKSRRSDLEPAGDDTSHLRRSASEATARGSEWTVVQKVLAIVIGIVVVYSVAMLMFDDSGTTNTRSNKYEHSSVPAISTWLMSKLAVIHNDSPRIVSYANFLTEAQCTYLILLANAGMRSILAGWLVLLVGWSCWLVLLVGW